MTRFDNPKEKKRSQWSWWLYGFGCSASEAVGLLAICAVHRQPEREAA